MVFPNFSGFSLSGGLRWACKGVGAVPTLGPAQGWKFSRSPLKRPLACPLKCPPFFVFFGGGAPAEGAR